MAGGFPTWRQLLRLFLLMNGVAFTILGFATNYGILDELSVLVGSFVVGYVISAITSSKKQEASRG